MKTRIEEYSVGELARIAGVSVRTLHHYHETGLLQPSHVGANGYRYYGRTEMLRLQEIMLYRDVGLSLTEISDLLEGPIDAVDRLVLHRDRLKAQNRRTVEMIDTLDATIAYLKGERDMALDDLYKPFSAKKQAEYQEWLIKRFGADMAEKINTANAAVAAIPGGASGAMELLRQIETRLVEQFEAGLAHDSDELRETMEEHRAWVAKMWGNDCTADGFAGLAELYVSHPDFVARYEALSPRFSTWFSDAMKAHAARLEGPQGAT